MTKRKGQRRTTSQKALWLMSLFLVSSMLISLIVVALPSPPEPTPAPLPTLTPAPLPTSAPEQPTPTLSPTLPVSPTPPPSPTLEPTEPIMGPAAPTETPTITPTQTIAPTQGRLPFTFAVCGDSRDNPEVYGDVLEAVRADGSEFLIHTGDLVNEGTKAQWQAFVESMEGFEIPFYPVAGNHDGLSGKLDGFLAHSGAPASHYSFDRSPVHFALADSHHGGITAGELAWLRTDLGATALPVKIVVLHHPPFDPDGTDHIMAFGAKGFMELMVEEQVTAVFSGHIHAFAQEERDGVLYTITGGAGAPLYGGDHPEAYHHYLRVSVVDEEIAIEVVEV